MSVSCVCAAACEMEHALAYFFIFLLFFFFSRFSFFFPSVCFLVAVLLFLGFRLERVIILARDHLGRGLISLNFDCSVFSQLLLLLNVVCCLPVLDALGTRDSRPESGSGCESSFSTFSSF